MPQLIRTTLHGDEAVAYMALLARLAALLQCSENLVVPAFDPAAPNSRMAVARAKNLWDPYAQAWQLLSAAEDHLQTILEILRADQLPRFALYSLLRPAVTAGVRMAYLVELSIPEAQRLGRALNLRCENLMEQNKVKPDKAHLAARIAHLEQRASENGVKMIPSAARKDSALKRPGFGEHQPKEIELVQAYMKEGELLYRVLSAHVHAQPWVVLMNTSRATKADDPHVSSMPTDVDTTLFGNMLAIALKRHEQNLVDMFVLAGYPVEAFKSAMTTALARAKTDVLPRANGS